MICARCRSKHRFLDRKSISLLMQGFKELDIPCRSWYNLEEDLSFWICHAWETTKNFHPLLPRELPLLVASIFLVLTGVSHSVWGSVTHKFTYPEAGLSKFSGIPLVPGLAWSHVSKSGELTTSPAFIPSPKRVTRQRPPWNQKKFSSPITDFWQRKQTKFNLKLTTQKLEHSANQNKDKISAKLSWHARKLTF